MPRINQWVCTECGTEVAREEVTMKRAVFLRHPLQRGGTWRTFKTATTAHLCPTCLADDPVMVARKGS